MSFTVNPKAASTKQTRGRGRGTYGQIRGGSVINRGNINVSRPSVRTGNSNSVSHTPVTNRLPPVTATRPGPRTGVSPSRNIRGSSRPAGRGRNRGTMYDSQYDDGTGSQDPNNTRNTTDDNKLDNRIQHATGYTVVSPNEKKRREITEQAQRNMKVYEDYKQQTRLQHVSYVGTTGGGLVSEGEARQKAVINQSKAAYNSRVKRESVRAAIRQQENETYEQKKQAARKQAELNEERRKREEERRQVAMSDDMRRKNAAFLDRLEAKSSSQKNKVTESKPSPTASSAHFTPGKPEVTTRTFSRNPCPPVSMAADTHESISEGHHHLDLNQLQMMFPDCSRNYLQDILLQTGSLEATVNILGEFD